jgi:SAM-dependent methyltransferase
VGVEPFAAGLAEARRRVGDHAELLQATLEQLTYANEFDVVGAFDVLEHIDDDRQAIAGLARLAKPGGILVVTVPQHMWLWSGADEVAQHRRRYRRGELEVKVVAAGFSLLLSTSFACSLLPPMLISRRLGLVRPEDELVLPRLIDAFFESLLDAERRLINRQFRFPLGARAFSWRANRSDLRARQHSPWPGRSAVAGLGEDHANVESIRT